MRRVLLAVCLSLLVCVSAFGASEEVSDIVTVNHNPSQFFAKGLELYRAGEYTKSMITLKKAVEEGDGWAAAIIASIYSKGGDGIEQNSNNAVKWMKKAKELGYPSSDAFFALCYAHGTNGFPKDYNRAYQLIHNIENIDEESDAIPNIAYLFYLNGWGTPKDLNKAKQFALRIKGEKFRQDALKKIQEAEESSKAIPASYLISEVGKNHMRFDKNYKGKRITVEGFVGRIEEQKGKYVLALWGGERLTGPFDYIECRFNADAEDSLLEFDKGDVVKIEGSYKGKENFQVGAFILQNCTIIN